MTLKCRRKKLAAGLFIVGLLVLLGLCAPFVSMMPPDLIDQEHLLSPPGPGHPMGTDQMGRDVFSRLAYGGRVSLTIGVVVMLVATFVGLLIGALSGYYGGILDYLLMRLTDVMLCFPVFFLLLSLIAILEPSPAHIIAILGLTGWMGQARLVRAEILSQKNREYVLIAKAYGASDGRLIARHLVPNAMGPVLVASVFGVAGAILAESSLSFLGLGIQPPTPSWGNMLNDARATLGVAWWQSIYPGSAIFMAIIGFHLIGEGLQDVFTQKP